MKRVFSASINHTPAANKSKSIAKAKQELLDRVKQTFHQEDEEDSDICTYDKIDEEKTIFTVSAHPFNLNWDIENDIKSISFNIDYPVSVIINIYQTLEEELQEHLFIEPSFKVMFDKKGKYKGISYDTDNYKEIF